MLKKLMKYGSSDNLSEKYSKQDMWAKRSELNESIRVLRDRNSDMRMRLNI